MSPLLVVAVFAVGMRIVMEIRQPAFQATSVVLTLCLIALWASALLISAQLVFYERAHWTFAAGTIAVMLGWTWQRIAFLRFVPHQTLGYGFFLTPEGARPRFFLIEVPEVAVTIALVLGALISCGLAWREGARWSLVSAVAWWLVAYLLFSFPSEYLRWQGDAAVFI